LASSLNNFAAGLGLVQQVFRIETRSFLVLLPENSAENTEKTAQKQHNSFNWMIFFLDENPPSKNNDLQRVLNPVDTKNINLLKSEPTVRAPNQIRM